MSRKAPLLLGWLLVPLLHGCALGTIPPQQTSRDDGEKPGGGNQEQTVDADAASAAIVAPLFTEGMEVVIRPLPEKVKAAGLTREQLQELRFRRFTDGAWRTKIEGKEIDLTEVAEITVRKLYAPPFTVDLPDGRRAVVTPNPARVGTYLVTGEHFESDVRAALAEFTGKDPAKACVLEGIPVPGGQIPNHWGPDHVHISNGEPISLFATIEIRERKKR
jgi:hypothetical protein